MSRILGIDFGMKRCGMAMTDSLQISINPLPTVTKLDLLEKCLEKLNDEDISTLILGLPLHADGTETYLKKEIDTFISQLKKKYSKALDIQFVDESYSSSEAKQLIFDSGIKKKKRRDKSKIDQMSAVILIKRYLNY